MEFDTHHMGGHKLVSIERYKDDTRHMIEFDILRGDFPLGAPGERFRLFLSDGDYAEMQKYAQKKQIKIRRYAHVTEGNIVYERKRKK